MLKSPATPVVNVPVPHSLGPVYYRNSFEKRLAKYGTTGSRLSNLDPCFLNEAQISASGVSGNTVAIVEDSQHAKSGAYLAKITGTAAVNGTYYYKYGDAKIEIKEDMILTFWKYAVNEQGKYTSLSLQLNDGTFLHNIANLTDVAGLEVNPSNARGEVGAWTKHEIVIGQGDLIGKTITGILLGYENASAGSFEAYFDNILIADASYVPPVEYAITVAATAGGVVSGNNTYLRGERVTVTATPNNGYNFVNWTIDGVEVADTESYTFFAAENVHLVANFGFGNGINAIANGGVVSATEYYNLQGLKVSNPKPGEFYIVKIIYESGNTEMLKQILRK
jgi:hypothetical protein